MGFPLLATLWFWSAQRVSQCKTRLALLPVHPRQNALHTHSPVLSSLHFIASTLSIKSSAMLNNFSVYKEENVRLRNYTPDIMLLDILDKRTNRSPSHAWLQFTGR